MKLSKIILAAFIASASGVNAEIRRPPDAEYSGVIAKTAAMLSDPEARRTVQDHGLTLLNVTWEDTGRFKGSAVGPNISDMTIQIQNREPSGAYKLTCMPVIRHPNFSDRTADVPLDRFFVLVGNERGGDLRRVSLRDLLGDLRSFLSEPGSWSGDGKSLLAERDTHALVSAQAAFLPVPKSGLATFNPVVFNYQSYDRNPAVLTILATREGTSVTVIDNKRDAFAAGMTWGQRLFFNRDGERASLTGQRLSDFESKPRTPSTGGTPSAAGQEGLNMVLLVQVPLKQKERLRRAMSFEGEMALGAPMPASKAAGRSDVEAAVIGHGEVEGPFTEIDNLAIERDPAFPIRVTVQFYKATSNGAIDRQDVRQIASQIERVYEEGDYVGSLVTGGHTNRPTEHSGPKFEPPGWWGEFWERHYRDTGMDREQTAQFLRRLFGPHWTNISEDEMRRAIECKRKNGNDVESCR